MQKNEAYTFRKKIHPEDRRIFDKAVIESIKKNESVTSEFRIICNSTIKYVSSIIYSSNREDDATILRGTVQDITDRKIAEQKLLEIKQLKSEHEKKLRDAIFLTKEREQKRIAQELHDDIGSSLTVIKFALHQLDLSDDKKSNLNNSLTAIIKKVRNLSNELSPSILEEFGLFNALRNLIETIKDSTPIVATFISNVSEIIGLNKDVEISIYRIVQELLTNILKYSNATTVDVSFNLGKDKIELTISDNGNGFIPSKQIFKKDSLGLMNIESRIEYIHATIKYKKNTPRGTIVKIEKKIQ